MAYKLTVTKDAIADIDEIIGYIVNSLNNPIAARNMISEIEGIYNILEENPNTFAYCNDAHLKARGYRKVNVKNYIVFYRVDQDKNTVYIMRVIYGRRDYIKLI